MGSGADTELVKGVATAGCGTYHFIENIQEIEEKVILALQKQYSPVQIIQKVIALDEKDKEVPAETNFFGSAKGALIDDYAANF